MSEGLIAGVMLAAGALFLVFGSWMWGRHAGAMGVGFWLAIALVPATGAAAFAVTL